MEENAYDRGIDDKMIDDFARSFHSDAKNKLAQNAVSKSKITDIALNREAIAGIDHSFSHEIARGKVTSQDKSGLCWLFAGLNALRARAGEKMNIKDFELSQNYLLFWDKLERSNYFLENIIRTAKELVDSRTVMWLLKDPIEDGGQWNMFVNLVQKYEVVPKEVMRDTFNRSNTTFMDMILRRKLRKDASILRGLCEKGKSMDELRVKKGEMMNDVYKILSVNLGEPPKKFRWQYRDKDGKFFRIGDITSKEFFKRYVDLDFDDYVSLIDCPQKTKRYDHTYTIKFLNNMEGGRIVKYLNVRIDLLKECAAKSIVDGEPVWFCSDVGKMMETENGIMNPDLFDYELVYGTRFDMDKATELDYGESFMTHAMVLTGVDMEGDRPIKWNVENSWGSEKEGKKIGKDGYFVMSDEWFSSYVYEVVVHKRYLPEDLLRVLEEEPTVLEPWDPMGTVARSFGGNRP